MAKDVKSIIEGARLRKEQVFEEIPSKYHRFIIILEDEEFVGYEREFTPEEINQYGIHVKADACYITIGRPYMLVDGRVKWARDEHREANAKLHIHAPVIAENNRFLSVTVESELLGSAAGNSMINVGNVGFEATSPIEVAQTSAVGRALGLLGYGLIGGGVASAEEVLQSKKAKDESVKEQVGEQTTPVSVPANNKQQPQKQMKKGEVNDMVTAKFIVSSAPVINKDDTITFEVTSQKGNKRPALVPKNLQEEALLLNIHDVIEATGWANDKAMRIKTFSLIQEKQAK